MNVQKQLFQNDMDNLSIGSKVRREQINAKCKTAQGAKIR